METKAMDKMDVSIEDALVINRVLDLPVKKAWQALTEPEAFKKWWGPNGYTCPSSNIEPRVGGQYLNCMRGPDGKDNWSVGEVKEIIPGKKLVITDSFSDEKGNKIPGSEINMPGKWPDEMLITFELEEAEGATKLHIIHEGIPLESQDDCRQGWNECLDKLEKNV